MERRALCLFGLGIACWTLAACSGVTMKKGEKKRAGRDTPHGAGVLSGKDGEFVIFRIEGDPEESEDGAKTEEGAKEEAKE